jgi:hypothetical protein
MELQNLLDIPPDLKNTLFGALLFRLGGEQTFTMAEMDMYLKEIYAVRVLANPLNYQLTLRIVLRSQQTGG